MPTTPPTVATLSWPVVGGAIIGMIVRLLKSERVPTPFDKIPPKLRPLFALALGALQAPIETIVSGTPWPTALVNGLLAAAFAVFAHQTVIEGLRDGKEVLQGTAPVEVPPESRVPPETPPTPPAGASADETAPPTALDVPASASATIDPGPAARDKDFQT